MQDMRKMIMIIAAVAMLTACGSGQTGQVDPEADTTATVPVEKLALPLPEPGVVQTVGKVVAERYADLAFETALPIEQVLVRNGQKVRKGQVLATLDQFKLRNDMTQKERAVEQAQLRIEQAHLQMQDVIIAHGFDPDKAAQIPSNVTRNSDLKSGYTLSKSQLATAKVQLEAARHDLQSGVLTAPFDGVVANLSVQAHQLRPTSGNIRSAQVFISFPWPTSRNSMRPPSARSIPSSISRVPSPSVPDWPRPPNSSMA